MRSLQAEGGVRPQRPQSPPPSGSEISRSPTPPRATDIAFSFAKRLEHVGEQHLRLKYEINEVVLFLDNTRSEFTKGNPEEVKEEIRLHDMGSLRDELEYAINKVKYEHDRLQSQVIALQLEYISQPDALAGDTENRPANSFETQLLYAGALLGKIAWTIDWHLWRSWGQIFEARNGMWGDLFIPAEGSQESQYTMANPGMG